MSPAMLHSLECDRSGRDQFENMPVFLWEAGKTTEVFTHDTAVMGAGFQWGTH
jgi:hypothetical protein